LILRKIIKIVARVQQGSDFKAKMHQIRFGCGSALNTAGGAYSAPPNPLAALNGPTSKGRERRETEREGREREGRRGRGKENEGKGRKGIWHTQLLGHSAATGGGVGREGGEGRGRVVSPNSPNSPKPYANSLHHQ